MQKQVNTAGLYQRLDRLEQSLGISPKASGDSRSPEKATPRDDLERNSGVLPQVTADPAGGTAADAARAFRVIRGGSNTPSMNPLDATSSSGQPIVINNTTNIGTQMNTGNRLRDARYSPTDEDSPGGGSRMRGMTEP